MIACNRRDLADASITRRSTSAWSYALIEGKFVCPARGPVVAPLPPRKSMPSTWQRSVSSALPAPIDVAPPTFLGLLDVRDDASGRNAAQARRRQVRGLAGEAPGDRTSFEAAAEMQRQRMIEL